MNRIPFVVVCLACLVTSVPSYAQAVDVARLPGDITPFEDQVFLSLAAGSSSDSEPLPGFPRGGDRAQERLTIETITIQVSLPIGQSPEVRYDTSRDGQIPIFRQLSLRRQGITGIGANLKALYTATLPVRFYEESSAIVASRFYFRRSGGSQGTATASVTASGYITQP